MGRRGRVLGAFAVVAAAPSAAAALMATRPRLLTVLGWNPAEPRTPADVGLDAEDVVYRGHARGWWVAPGSGSGVVVLVHGLDVSDDPRATDTGPQLDVAAALVGRGIGVLIINLGYATTGRFSAGSNEADDIVAAVEWVAARTDQAISVFAVSAGGHAAIAAARRSVRIAGVVTDSSYVDGGSIVVAQAGDALGLPAPLFRGAPTLMRVLAGVAALDLAAGSRPLQPMLHIHGDADTAVATDNLDKMAAITGGETWLVAGADHVRSYETDPETYLDRVIPFLEATLI